MCFTGIESYKREGSKSLPLLLVPPLLQKTERRPPLSSPFYTLFLCSPFPSGPSIILAIFPYQSTEASPLSLRGPPPPPSHSNFKMPTVSLAHPEVSRVRKEGHAGLMTQDGGGTGPLAPNHLSKPVLCLGLDSEKFPLHWG